MSETPKHIFCPNLQEHKMREFSNNSHRSVEITTHWRDTDKNS